MFCQPPHFVLSSERRSLDGRRRSTSRTSIIVSVSNLHLTVSAHTEVLSRMSSARSRGHEGKLGESILPVVDR
jgi:hypothetical protein